MFFVKKLQKLRLEHFESYSRFLYCMHNSVYRVFWPSGRFLDCFILILFRHSTTGPDLPIYRTMPTVWKAWITSKMLCPQISNFVHIKGLLFCILSKVSINFLDISKSLFHPLFQEKITFLALLWRCSTYHSTHKNFVNQIHGWIYKS